MIAAIRYTPMVMTPISGSIVQGFSGLIGKSVGSGTFGTTTETGAYLGKSMPIGGSPRGCSWRSHAKVYLVMN